MRARLLRGLIVAAAVFGAASPAHATISALDNGTVRVAVDLNQGGRIVWLSKSSGTNADNLVTDVEQSWYAADGWHGSNQDLAVVGHSNDGRTLYVNATYVLCSCNLETWLTLRGRAVIMRNRLTTYRLDVGAPPPTWQELPALYTSGPNRVVTYAGTFPYTRGPTTDVSDIARTPFYSPGALTITGTEHWAALLDDNDVGVGLVESDVQRFAVISGLQGGWPSGYVAGIRPEIVDAEGTFEYTAALVVGSLGQIRTYAYAHRPDARPSYVFARDRQHFTETNAFDTGLPRGALRLRVDGDHPQLVGPAETWSAADVPRLYVRGAWHTAQATAELQWDGGARAFRVVPDGRFHTYRVDLSRTPGYFGVIDGIRLQPVVRGEPYRWVDVTCISYRPCPVDQAAERRILAGGRAPLLDTFDRLDASFWQPKGTTVQDGKLLIPIGGSVASRCVVGGDFDVRVRYTRSTYPPEDRLRIGLSLGRATVGPEQFMFDGALRLERVGSTLYRTIRNDWDGRWRVLDVGSSTGAGRIVLSVAGVGAPGETVAFDDVRILRGRVTCP